MVKTLNFDGTTGEDAWVFSPEFKTWKMCTGTKRWQHKYTALTEELVTAGTTDQYCDLYPVARLCFDPTHGHPLGGGKWWLDGYRKKILASRAVARAVQPDFMMVPEHRSETGLDLYDLYVVNYWAKLDGTVFRGAVGTGVPVPIMASFEKQSGGEPLPENASFQNVR